MQKYILRDYNNRLTKSKKYVIIKKNSIRYLKTCKYQKNGDIQTIKSQSEQIPKGVQIPIKQRYENIKNNKKL